MPTFAQHYSRIQRERADEDYESFQACMSKAMSDLERKACTMRYKQGPSGRPYQVKSVSSQCGCDVTPSQDEIEATLNLLGALRGHIQLNRNIAALRTSIKHLSFSS